MCYSRFRNIWLRLPPACRSLETDCEGVDKGVSKADQELRAGGRALLGVIGKKEVFAYARRCLLLHIFGAGDDLRCGINISFVILGCNFVLTKNDVTFVVLVVTL